MVWTRDAVTRQISFNRGYEHHPYVVHQGVSLADGATGEQPPRLHQTGPYEFVSEVDFAVRVVNGQILVVRSTGATRYF